jgi:galactokinase
LEVNGIDLQDNVKIAKLAQAVENDFIGSPCGLLDQIMIISAKESFGTLYNPKNHKISYLAAGKGDTDFRLVCLDTGTVRPGLEKSTYKIRQAQCQEFIAILRKNGYDIKQLADIKDEKLCDEIQQRFGDDYPDHCGCLNYLVAAQKRFGLMLDAWQSGDIETVGRIFRQDGLGLRDDYKISGPELEAMCDIARGVPGVLGERMLGGGDKGAAGAIVKADCVEKLKKAVDEIYPKKFPALADKYAVHICKTVDGTKVFEDLF